MQITLQDIKTHDPMHCVRSRVSICKIFCIVNCLAESSRAIRMLDNVTYAEVPAGRSGRAWRFLNYLPVPIKSTPQEHVGCIWLEIGQSGSPTPSTLMSVVFVALEIWKVGDSLIGSTALDLLVPAPRGRFMIQ